MIVLASASPRRHLLLAALGVEFRVEPSRADETLPAGLAPEEAAREVARRKALRVARGTDLPVLAADTLVVAADGEVLGKPADVVDAQRMLRTLSGTTHAVVTGVCLALDRGARTFSGAETTRVTMRRLEDSEVRRYAESGEGLGKAGAYAIQETADRFVARVDGSRSNVVGLPLELVRRLLAEAGIGAPGGGP